MRLLLCLVKMVAAQTALLIRPEPKTRKDNALNMFLFLAVIFSLIIGTSDI